MDTQDAFIRAILDRPDDDLPRLIYADWLEEQAGDEVCAAIGPYHDDKCDGGRIQSPNAQFTRNCGNCHGTGRVGNGFAERAEFIRVQCELATMHGEEDCGCEDCRRRHALRRRERELLTHDRFFAWFGIAYAAAQHGPIMARESEPAEPSLDDQPFPVKVRRGFIESITLPCAAFVQHAAAIFACQPVTTVRLSDTEPVAYNLEDFCLFRRPKRHTEDVPPEIYDALTAGARHSYYRIYETPEIGQKDLSNAAVAWGREQALAASRIVQPSKLVDRRYAEMDFTPLLTALPPSPPS